MHYIVYKTTNKLNGKCYIGTHKTKDLNDGYLGSGTILKRAIKKHGEANFEKVVLFDFDNAIQMFAKEAELVTMDFLMNENTYNLKVGGSGGFQFINSNSLSVRNINKDNAKFLATKANKKKAALYPNKVYVNTNCLECGVVFKINHNRDKFCSRSCSAKHNNRKRKIIPVLAQLEKLKV